MAEPFILTVAIIFYGYFILAAIFCLLSLIVIYHLLRFGFFSLTNAAVIIAYAAVSFILISGSLAYIYGADWSVPLFDPRLIGDFAGSIRF